MTIIRAVVETPLAPEAVLAAAHDFSGRREKIFPAVSTKRLQVHDRGDSEADVTEGTRAGPIVNWERCRYDWSTPGSVKALVTDSNVYDPVGSYWEIKATPDSAGSRVEMIWAREFRSGPRGRFFGFLFGKLGARIFNKYAKDVLENLEKLKQDG
ncbi:MAG: SRPBCC family protein [Solirubrobacterales bacterium]